MQGIAEAIDRVAALATGAQKSILLPGAPERKGVYILVGPDGKAETKVAAPDWHREHLATPSDLKEFVQKYQTEKSAVYYSESQVSFIYDQGDRRDKAMCDLMLSPQYLWLTNDAKNAMNQQTFVRTLRIIFRGCHEGNLLGIVRNLKWNSAGESAGAIQQGRESMAKSVIAEVRGEAAIPEETALVVPVFENHAYAARIACAVEVLPAEQMFRLTPYPMALRHAMDEALASIAELFDGEGLPPLHRGSAE